SPPLSRSRRQRQLLTHPSARARHRVRHSQPPATAGPLRALALLGSSSPLLVSSLSALCFFFFQAEDGIRDRNVTGVQTCALPISPARRSPSPRAGTLP